jgi:hypothetical protein
VGPGTVSLHAGDIALLALVAMLIVGGFALWRWLSPRATRRAASGAVHAVDPEDRAGGAAAVVPALMCVIVIAIWVSNPFAALLIVPALHLWMWVVDPERSVPRVAAFALLLVGLAPAILVALYYAISLGFGPGALLWTGVLMIAGGQVGLLVALEWCIVLGCTASVLVIAVRGTRAARPEQTPVTVRGPVTYAGPGSLGGTESALRR